MHPDISKIPENINRQIKLPFVKSLEIAVKSIRVRFFRSLITILSLVLAVSFLSFVQVSNDMADRLFASGDQQLCRQLVQAGFDLSNEGSVGSSPKQRWLVVLSLLVCVVGIINTQLMAVTERFREIGTMKCLGALNRFIMRLFLMEAGIQGFVGAALGAITGCLFAVLNMTINFGVKILINFPWTDVTISISFATATGCILSLIGVLYPAFIAARMQPVEAMRREY